MTREQFKKHTVHETDTSYKGKHEPKHYKVWMVKGPAGPEVTTIVCGRNIAEEMIQGCWDWEITHI